MRRHPIVIFLAVLVLGSLFLAAFAGIVQVLWNHLMPDIFGLKAITFWQGLGLLVLSWIFFGSWRGVPGRHGMHRRRWARMSPEERERFRAHMREHWHGRRDDDGAANDVAEGRAP